MSIESIEKRLDAATPGPWESISTGNDEYVMHRYPKGVPVTVAHLYANDDNAVLTAHAPTDLRLLLEVAKAVGDRRHQLVVLGESHLVATYDALEAAP